MNDYPAMIVPADHVEPVPRRVRAMLDGTTVLDTTNARYVWEWPHYPQYYVPAADVRTDLLTPTGQSRESSRGLGEVHELRVAGTRRPEAAVVLAESPIAALSETIRFDWCALDTWFEEDEVVFGHPRSPYVRVDALRSTRTVRVELGGTVLAESSSPVMVFETGLPTRYYLNRTELNWACLTPTNTVTMCPYKGTTSRYWSVTTAGSVHKDLAWSYEFPARQLSPIAGLVSFYNEKVDILIDGEAVDRPRTHFFTR